MSTPAENLDTSAGAPAGGEVLDFNLGDDAWVLEPAYIDTPADDVAAPLPTADDKTANSAAVAAEEKPTPTAAEVAAAGIAPGVVKADEAAPAKPVETATEKTDGATAADPELSATEQAIVGNLPPAEQPAAISRMKRAYFMDHYLGDKPIHEVREHLQERSPSRFAEFRDDIVKEYFDKPETVLAETYQRDPATYAKLANAVYAGDPKTFAALMIGRQPGEVDPAVLKTAYEFYEANKDKIVDDGTGAGLSAENLEALKGLSFDELENYFPEQAGAIQAAIEAAKQVDSLKAKLSESAAKAELGKEAKTDTGEDPRLIAEREEQALWDLGQDTVGDFVGSLALDPVKGAGIAVTKEERESAPLVALLKDFKSNVLFDGLMVDGKSLLPMFKLGLTEWGKDRKSFVEKLVQMGKFTKAREKNNVVELAQAAFPDAEAYYKERLQHPIFAEIDKLIELVSGAANVAPKMDAHIPGQLPAAKVGQPAATPGLSALSDDWLIQDAVTRSPR